MYARISTMQVKADKVAEIESRMNDVASKVQSIPGAVGVYVSWRADGQGVVSSIWESQGAADAGMETVKGIWGGLMDLLDGPPKVETYDRVRKLSA